jgi:hypothetical protein
MRRKIIGILVCVLLIIPFSVSASSKIINIEDNIDNEGKTYIFCIVYGRIENLSEEMLYGEIHYTFDAISVSGIEIAYAPLFQFYFERFYDINGSGAIPKASFRGFMSDNYIIGMFLLILVDIEYPN